MQANREVNWKRFGKDVREIVGKRSLREAARDIGVSRGTFRRAAQGLPVNVGDMLFLMALMPHRFASDYVKVPS